MDINKFIDEWITAANSYYTDAYLDFFREDAVLDDPSVGREFTGQRGIRDYFESYFIGYRTQTTLTRLDVIDNTHAYVEVAFTGNFPEGNIAGCFEITFNDNKIGFIKADLIN